MSNKAIASRQEALSQAMDQIHSHLIHNMARADAGRACKFCGRGYRVGERIEEHSMDCIYRTLELAQDVLKMFYNPFETQ